MTVEGVITLTVSDAESFASEPEVQEALQAVVATSLPGVDPSDVFITGIEVLLRRLSATRVLQGGGVRVDYVVAVPAELDATAVSESLAQVTPSAMTLAIVVALANAGVDAEAFSPEVLEMSAWAGPALSPLEPREFPDGGEDQSWDHWEDEDSGAGSWRTMSVVFLPVVFWAV